MSILTMDDPRLRTVGTTTVIVVVTALIAFCLS